MLVRLQTKLTYIALEQPEPPSLLRQLSYQENTPVLGPDVDPQGWKTLPTVVVSGTVFGDHRVDISCTVSHSHTLALRALSLRSSPSQPQ